MRLLSLAIIAVSLISPRFASAAPPTPAEVLSGMQKVYADASDVSVSFRQEVTNTTFGHTAKSDGTLLIRRPGKMRWDYFAKERRGKPRTIDRHFISNGITLYVVEPDNLQVIKKDLKKNLLPTVITFLYGKGDLAADFTPKFDTSGTYGTKDDHVLALAPKKPATQYKRLFLVVDRGTLQVKESIVIDAAGNKNHFFFSALNLKAAAKDAHFELDLKSPAFSRYRIVEADR